MQVTGFFDNNCWDRHEIVVSRGQYQASGFNHDKTVNKDHGRIEIFKCLTISDLKVLRHLQGFTNWKNLATTSRIR